LFILPLDVILKSKKGGMGSRNSRGYVNKSREEGNVNMFIKKSVSILLVFGWL
jgi:hypothetical protein